MRVIRDIVAMLPFAALFLVVYLLYRAGAIPDAAAVATVCIVLIISVIAGFLRWASLTSTALVLVACIPFFVFLFALIYANLGLQSTIDQPVLETDYLYFSVVTFTTLGYGDLAPTPHARFFAATEALLGYFILSVFVSVIVVMSQRQMEARARQAEAKRMERERRESEAARRQAEALSIKFRPGKK